jgi:hypothetical protein
LFRERITLTDHTGLAAFLRRMKDYPPFADTPPRTG